MLGTIYQRKVARVLFDERHGEAWTVRSEVARRMRPSHPAAASYGIAAAELARRDFEIAVNSRDDLDDNTLAGADVLVIAHPSEAVWERTVGDDLPVFSSAEIDAIERFVSAGGGLVLIGEEEAGKFGSNVNVMLGRFGLHLETVSVRDYERIEGPPYWVHAEASTSSSAPEIVRGVYDTCFYRAGVITSENPLDIVLRTRASADPAGVGLLAAHVHGEGRVVTVTDSDMFGDDYIVTFDNRQLWLNLAYWAAMTAFRADATPLDTASAGLPAWLHLKAATNALRRLQEPSGAVDLTRHDIEDVRGHVATMVSAIADFAPYYPEQAEHLAQVTIDLKRWVDGGCGEPDFKASLALFHPELNREDGAEHLVVFPMYTPNASRDTRFEALIVRTPWPDFVARIERDSHPNAKFVPVQLVDGTDGYESECAVLFPEAVSVAGSATNCFRAIFCDRESARFRRSTLAAAEVLRMDLPPDAQALLASADLSLETYILWDMIHDRWHSRGHLPFDPFMIRQRLPYWMYALEELRVDLASYGSAARLAQDGFAFARYVQYAIVFDRLLRFPIVGSRTRNYDGLGGQLLFAFLHASTVVQWSDNRLMIDWARLDAAVGELRGKIEELYRRGIDMSRVSYWIASHDLVASYVRPNVASQWKSDSRVYSDESDPKAWIDRVLDDEFPLSMFYEALKRKVAT